MKKLFVLLTATIIAFSFQNSTAQKTEWKELKDFHSVMSKSFHPTEDGNFKPLRENAAELTAKAKAWAAAKVPKGFDKELTPKILKDLLAKCEDIEKSVKENVGDDELKQKITAAHETFHQIVEKCRKPEGDEKHEGHEH